MSTTVGAAPPPRAERPAEPVLLARLIDDAAVFPPGLALLADAVPAYLARTRYAGLVGPLLVPAAAAAEAVALAEGQRLDLSLIARPGAPLEPVREGVADLRGAPGVRVTGVEIGWSARWRALCDLGVPVTVEIPRTDGAAAVADVAEAAAGADDSAVPHVQAKFRTGATDAWAWPDERELAGFIRACIDRDLGFKLTGGLHHAVRSDRGGEPQHGVLNVLAAVRHGLNGAEEAEMGSLLAERDPQHLVDIVTRMSTADASIVRAFFTAYGCCNVLEPIGELAAFGLLGED